MKFESPERTIFYTIEKAIKHYRKFGQKRITESVKDITIDQALVLIIIERNPELSQMEIANILFKDHASITRMINIMVNKIYIDRKINTKDRRRFHLNITTKGMAAISKLKPIIYSNRNHALMGMSDLEIIQLQSLLHKISSNCVRGLTE